MQWTSRYTPPNPENWQGRPDTAKGAALFRIMQLLDLSKPVPTHTSGAFALLGFCCDEGVRRNLGRPGAVDGPHAIREALAKLPVQKEGLLCYDAGDIICADGDLESTQRALGAAVTLLLQQHITPIVLGGGHELAWGHYQGIAKQIADTTLGIVNFDAHFDMRPLLENNTGSSGTPFLQIANALKEAKLNVDYNCIGIQHTGNSPALFATAAQYGVHTLLADDIQLGKTAESERFIDRVIAANQHIYLTLCLDVFATAHAPGVSAPQALGLTPWQVLPLLRRLAESGKVISYDIAELAPELDVDQRTAKLAANFIYEIIHARR